MAFVASIDWKKRAWTFLGLGLVIAITAWLVPARWRSLDPAVLRAAGRNSTGLVDTALQAAQLQLVGIAARLNEVATSLGLPGTNNVTAAIAANRVVPTDVQWLGGPDPSLAPLLVSRPEGQATNVASALEVFMPAAHRAKLRAQLADSRSPGVQALLRTEEMPTQQFVPAGRPGGQPFEAVVLMAATLYERERFSPALVQELRELAERATGATTALPRLENFYLNLLSLSRRLDWTSLSELARRIPNLAGFEQIASAVRANPNDLSFLYASALLAGETTGVTRQFAQFGTVGRQGLAQGLRDGTGAIRWLGQVGRPMMPGLGCPAVLAQAIQRAPEAWAWGRTGMFVVASILLALSLSAFAQVGVPFSSHAPSTGRVPFFLIAILMLGFFVIASEPVPPRIKKSPLPKFYLDFAALTKSPAVANSTQPQKKIMEPTTLITVLIFGAIQLAVYVICLRKINEIVRRPESAWVRLKLLENEENLFDAGLYVGIGGTAAALVMQVLQMLDANLLAAYSSNLMGIICVALVKIGHVRLARRRLILESQAEAAEAAANAAEEPVSAANPFNAR